MIKTLIELTIDKTTQKQIYYTLVVVSILIIRNDVINSTNYLMTMTWRRYDGGLLLNITLRPLQKTRF